MTASETRHDGPWTVDDLADLPDDGQRYELIEGSLLVSPAPAKPHLRAATRLQRLLLREAPPELTVGQNGGVLTKTRDTYFIPDLFVVHERALEGAGAGFRPDELLLVVEVLSPQRHSMDLVTKRHYYAAMGIPRYWIVDPSARTLTVLALEAAKLKVAKLEAANRYRDEIVVAAGQRWHTDDPFPLELDLADFC
jgi:Uma2 family endonuclease